MSVFCVCVWMGDGELNVCVLCVRACACVSVSVCAI